MGFKYTEAVTKMAPYDIKLAHNQGSSMVNVYPILFPFSTLAYKATGSWEKFTDATATIKDPGRKNDLYLVFRKDQAPDQHLFTLDWMEFKP